jgi:hypothetical protein
LPKKINEITHDEWLEIGINNKWCTDIVCYTHDSVEMTDDEVDEFDEGLDPCISIIRLW